LAGRIRDADIALVRERSPIDEIVGLRLTLRSAGGDNLKGLCPFHDEKTPSFSVSPPRGVFYCFGCGQGGDVITFVMKTELLNFTEAVQWLADRAGIQITYTEAGPAPVREHGLRKRLVAAHTAAAKFYAEQLTLPAARIAREFLDERGFDQAAAQQFGCGFAPADWDALSKQLLAQGFSEQELVTGGLAKQGRSGSLIDRFRRRLMWPIKDLTGEVIGFGARRLFVDDDGPKYLNTPDTPIYKKSQVLYGVESAKREIARDHRAVIVEGYTDVMACHLAGVPTAVATCGTAFGAEHISVLRRLLMDQDEFRGEVIFTFDGDEAGQKAALRAFEDDQRFVAQTFIAISPDGMDPCELRQTKGDAAVRDLVARREPLIAFALRSTLDRYDLETVEGRVAALRSSAPLVAKIKDRALRPEYARRLAGDLGMDVDEVTQTIATFAHSNGHSAPATRTQQAGEVDPAAHQVEREALRLAIQYPVIAGPLFDAIDEAVFTDPVHIAIRQAISAAGGAVLGHTGPQWIDTISQTCDDLVARSTIVQIAVEELRCPEEPDAVYAGVVLARLQELAVTRKVVQLKGRLQRTNPVEANEDYTKLFTELLALEQHRRVLREQAIGGL
jgi:DNA primase